MASYNRVLLMGHLTRNPELRYTPSGTAVSDLGLAVNESFKNKAGEIVEQTCFVDVVVWGRQAETTSEYLHKGSPVFIEGRLQLDQWENKDGEKRSKLRVRADRVQFLATKDSSPAPSPAAEETTPHQNTPSAVPEPEFDNADDEDVPF